MKRAFEANSHILVCAPGILADLDAVGIHVASTRREGSLVFIDLAESLAGVTLTRLITSDIVDISPRYMDRFYFLSLKNDSGSRQQVLTEFFNVVADEYVQYIDPVRNAANIRMLLSYIRRQYGTLNGMRILDFGCGVGLSSTVAEAKEIELIGFDVCPRMRHMAAACGLTVWGPGQLASQPEESIDGAFASYVFHLLPSFGALRLLWRRMKNGAMFVANLHKNQGADVLKAALSGEFVEELQLDSDGEVEPHGRYVAYLKKG